MVDDLVRWSSQTVGCVLIDISEEEVGRPMVVDNTPAAGKSVQSLSANSDLEAGEKDPRGQPSVCCGVDQVSPHLREDEFRRYIAVEVTYKVPVGQFRRFCREENRGGIHENIPCWNFRSCSQVGNATRREVDDLRTGKGVDIGEVEDDSIRGGGKSRSGVSAKP